MNWETKTESTTKDEGINALCNRMGADGWEPWAVVNYHGVWGGTYVYFKRPVTAPATS